MAQPDLQCSCLPVNMDPAGGTDIYDSAALCNFCLMSSVESGWLWSTVEAPEVAFSFDMMAVYDDDQKGEGQEIYRAAESSYLEGHLSI